MFFFIFTEVGSCYLTRFVSSRYNSKRAAYENVRINLSAVRGRATVHSTIIYFDYFTFYYYLLHHTLVEYII